MKKSGVRMSAVAGFGMFAAVAIFALMALLMVVLGAGVYRSVAARTDANQALRSGISYITGKLRSQESGGELRIEKTEVGTDALVLSEQIDGAWYETRIYTHDGRLYEVFASRDIVFEPEAGQAIAEVDALNLEMRDGGLLRLEAEVNGVKSAVHVALRG